MDAKNDPIKKVHLFGPDMADSMSGKIYTGDIPFGLGFHMSPRQVEETLGIEPSDTTSLYGRVIYDRFKNQQAIDRFGADIIVFYSDEGGIFQIVLQKAAK